MWDVLLLLMEQTMDIGKLAYEPSLNHLMHEKAWKSVLTCWSPLTKIDDDGKTAIKTNLECTSEEGKSATSKGFQCYL